MSGRYFLLALFIKHQNDIDEFNEKVVQYKITDAILSKSNFNDGKITIDLHIIIEYGVNINVICKSIIQNVKYQLTLMTGLDVDQVNVCVEGFRVQEQE